jgi:hypothetical protein
MMINIDRGLYVAHDQISEVRAFKDQGVIFIKMKDGEQFPFLVWGSANIDEAERLLIEAINNGS